MATVKIPLNEWLPDQPSIVGLQEATNVVPAAVGYVPFPLDSYYSNATSDNILNVGTGQFSNITQLFAGSTTKLYKFNASTLNLDDVSKVGGYNASQWNFSQFGNSMLAVNNSEKIQAWTLGTSTTFNDLSATAPVAKYITVIRDFVVVANLDSETNPNKVQWSNIGDETNWTSGTASQSDFQLIPDGGSITGITGGEFGLVFLERGIVRMSYVGSPFFFQFDTISRNLGCRYSGSIVKYGQMSYFLSEDGFYACDGQSIIGIGVEKVDRFFFEDFNMNLDYTISSAIDPIRKLVVWNYPNNNNGRSLLVYHWELKKWSKVITTADLIVSASSSGFTLEDLDVFGTVDSIPTSFDSSLWKGGKFLFSGVRNNRIVTFTGDNSDGYIITQDIEQGYNSVVTLARPQIDNGSCTISVASRKNLNDTISFTTPAAMSSEGRVPLRSAGRYHRFKITPSGLWTSAIGTDVDFNEQGNR